MKANPSTPGTSAHEPHATRATRNGCALCVLLTALSAAGCQELVHMGQISDREGGFAVNDVRIEQQQPDGSWKVLDKTDGNGRWWIMKDEISGGGRIRIAKNGYITRVMREAEFLQEHNLVIPADSEGGWGGYDQDWADPGRR